MTTRLREHMQQGNIQFVYIVRIFYAEERFASSINERFDIFIHISPAFRINNTAERFSSRFILFAQPISYADIIRGTKRAPLIAHSSMARAAYQIVQRS